jgi:hypothetical protein
MAVMLLSAHLLAAARQKPRKPFKYYSTSGDKAQAKFCRRGPTQRKSAADAGRAPLSEKNRQKNTAEHVAFLTN